MRDLVDRRMAMSLHPERLGPVPKQTARAAHAAFPNGSPYLRLHDLIGSIYEDEVFKKLFPARGQHAEAPWRLAMVTVLQFVEGLSDRQAADAVRGRIDWKYLLGLELGDPGFDHTVLSEFRTRLVDGHAERVRSHRSAGLPEVSSSSRCVVVLAALIIARACSRAHSSAAWARPAA